MSTSFAKKTKELTLGIEALRNIANNIIGLSSVLSKAYWNYDIKAEKFLKKTEKMLRKMIFFDMGNGTSKELPIDLLLVYRGKWKEVEMLTRKEVEDWVYEIIANGDYGIGKEFDKLNKWWFELSAQSEEETPPVFWFVGKDRRK